MKYPEYREVFKDAKWFRGHLCLKDGRYYKLVRVDGKREKQLLQFSYDELQDRDKELIEAVDKEEAEKDSRIIEYFRELLPAKQKLIDYVRANGRLVSRSKQSESEYWAIKSPVNGLGYQVRISGHVYPTGSMTNLNLSIIDTTDRDCRRFLELFNL